ncbi:MAG: hypothetical protein AAB364_00025 [Patescibacteria group bacterium]
MSKAQIAPKSKREFFLILLAVLFFIVTFSWGSSGQARIIDPLNPPDYSPKVASGYAWSPSIGWISFDNNGQAGGVDYGVILEAPDGTGSRPLSGFAWNPYIGWIKFDPVIANLYASSESAPPTLDSPWGARLDSSLNGGRFSGWARACVVFASNCTGALKDHTERGGWDGWIKFRSSDSGVAYGAAVDSDTNPQHFIGGHRDAWGADILGWISMCGNDEAYPPYLGEYCVSFANVTSSCQILGPAEDSNGVTTVGDGDDLVWHAQVAGGTEPYYMEWSGVANVVYDPSFVPPGSYETSLDAPVSYSCPGETDVDYGDQLATFNVIDAAGSASSCAAATTVFCDGQQEPTGDGEGDLDGDGKNITITSQPISSRAISSAKKLSNLATAPDADVAIAVKSIISLSNSSINLLDGSYQASVQCQLRAGNAGGDDPGVQSGFSACASTSMTLPPNSNAYFNIQVSPPLSSNLTKGSPYRVTIGDPENTDNDVSFLFNYSVGTVNPL